MRLKFFVAIAISLCVCLIARADTSTYNFTYSSTTGEVAGETANGTGSFTVSYSAGTRPGTLTAFSFTDTIDSSEGDSTFLYSGLGSVLSTDIVMTLGGMDLARLVIITKSIFGTDAGFGGVDFELESLASTVSGSTSYEGSGAAPDSAAGNTSGGGTISFISQTIVTPEPSSYLLLCTGLLGIFGSMKRRFAWGRATHRLRATKQEIRPSSQIFTCIRVDFGLCQPLRTISDIMTRCGPSPSRSTSDVPPAPQAPRVCAHRSDSTFLPSCRHACARSRSHSSTHGCGA